VHDELAEKIRLERILKRELIGPFRRQAEAFRVRQAANRRAPVDRLQDAMRAALEGHYARVSKAFRGIVAVKRSDGVDEAIALALIELRETWPAEQSRVIAETTERDQEEALIRARQMLIEQGETPDAANVAATAHALLLRRLRARTDAIAITETQAAAEATKQIEAEAMIGATPFVLAFLPFAIQPRAETGTKQWITMGDDRVRPAHAGANGQKVGVSDSFSVGADRLRFAGDVLNGSIGNVIRCRCMIRYEVG